MEDHAFGQDAAGRQLISVLGAGTALLLYFLGYSVKLARLPEGRA
jgi:hypothetical protein